MTQNTRRYRRLNKGQGIYKTQFTDFHSKEYWKNKKVEELSIIYVRCKVCNEDIIRGELCYNNHRFFAHVTCVEKLK